MTKPALPRIETGAKRVAIDSVSVFLYKVAESSRVRTKVFQLATIVQNVGAVGFFATDIPYGANQLSRDGVEETVVDGAIYKLRNTAHATGRHPMALGAGGITVFPHGLAKPRPQRDRKPQRRS